MATPTGAAVTRAAVLIAAHNEEPVIAATLESVLASYAAEDVFVFDDASTDQTAVIARRYLPASNVITHAENIGKSRGLEYALTRHVYPRGYQYVTIVDADTTLEPTYRERALAALEDEEVVCAAGQVKSRPEANLISVYRACLYFLWQAIFKRLFSAVNAIAIAPGCASTWKTAALSRIDFEHRMSTEDFHLSLQAHRRGLGRIEYVPGAVVWTQDPQTLKAFVRQAMRWSRAWWEAVRFHRLGLRWLRRGPDGRWHISGLDIANALLIVSMQIFFLRLLALLFFLFTPVDPFPEALFPATDEALATDLAVQFSVMLLAILVAAIATGRLAMVILAPAVVVLVVLEYLISTVALASVTRRQFRPPRRAAAASSAWVSPERRAIPVGDAQRGGA